MFLMGDVLCLMSFLTHVQKNIILLRVFFSGVCHSPPFSIDLHPLNFSEERKELCLVNSMGTLYKSLPKIVARFP